MSADGSSGGGYWASPNPKTWAEMGVRRHGEVGRRVVFEPYGDVDFIDLPSPVFGVISGPLGVTIQCADGLYHLTSEDGDPGNVERWRVVKVLNP